MSREEFRLILLLLLGWWIYRGWRRRELTHGLVTLAGVVAVVAVGVFIVLYGKLWHAWIFPVKDMPGAGH